jgi:predicted dehydrogenase
MLDSSRPDVLHVTVPPQFHAAIACQALERGIHVYVEKPFTVTPAETDRVLDLASAHGRLVCAGHDQLFDPIWQECRALVRRGELGEVVHVDCLLHYDLGGPFGKLVTADREHWIHRLPGKLFQNVIPHAIYKMTDFLLDEEPDLWAITTGLSTSGFPSELRVLVRGQHTTAQLLFSCAARPLQRLVRLYGTKERVEVDADAWVLRRYRAARLPGPFAKLELPAKDLCQAARALVCNVRRFLRAQIHYFAGMRRLFELFYLACGDGGEPPIPYAEIRRVTVLMDRIFRTCMAAPPVPGGSGPTKSVSVELNPAHAC